MSERSLGHTILRSLQRGLTTPPHTWLSQWKKREVVIEASREGYLSRPADYVGGELLVGGVEIMQDWERPLMKALADEAARSKGHVLEVGFGMGISATHLIEAGAAAYTVIEPHPGVLEFFAKWAEHQPVPVQAVPGFWEDVIDDLGEFDGILFDTYPVSEGEWSEPVYLSFIAKAAEHLRPGGVFTFYSGHPDALPDAEAALIRRHFSELEQVSFSGLVPPKDCQYYTADRMVVPICRR